MKKRILFLLFGLPLCGVFAAEGLTEALQKGLFEEEANMNPRAAITIYQSVVAKADQERKLAATAIFRLGECHRKLGQTNEARIQFLRIVEQFSDQTALVTLSKTWLESVPGARQTLPAADNTKPSTRDLDRNSLLKEYAAKEKEQRWLKMMEALFNNNNSANQQEVRKQLETPVSERLSGNVDELESLRVKWGQADASARSSTDDENEKQSRESAFTSANKQMKEAVEEQAAKTSKRLAWLKDELVRVAPDVVLLDDETQEIQRLQKMMQNSPDLINALSLRDGKAPLHEAAANGQARVVEFLLENHADIDRKDSRVNQTPLHYAAINGHKAVCALLLAHGANVNAQTTTGITPLYQAASRGHLQVCKTLLNAGAKVNIGETFPENRNSYSQRAGYTPLHEAINNGYTDVAALLVSSGAPLSTLSAERIYSSGAFYRAGNAPLHLAAWLGNKAIVELLIKSKADLNQTNTMAYTPLMMALENGRTEIAELLVDAGAQVNAPVAFGRSPFVSVIKSGSIPLVKKMLAHGARVNDFDNEHNTPLMVSLSTSPEITSILLAAKPDLEITNYSGRTALMMACENKETSRYTELLVSAGADCNHATAHSGYTPLMMAALPETMTAVLAGKPNLEQTNKSGMTALALCCYSATISPAFAELLLKAGAKPNAGSLVGIHSSLRAEYSPGTAEYFAWNKTVELAGYENLSIFGAVQHRRKDLVELLIQHGAKVNILNSSRETPLLLAQRQKSNEAARNSVPTPGGVILQPALPGAMGVPSASRDVRPTSHVKPVIQGSFDELAEILKKAGAEENYHLRQSICLRRKSQIVEVVRMDYLAMNKFTLYEVIAMAYYYAGAPFPFPDFKNVVIQRCDADGKQESIAVDLAARLSAAGGPQDMPLKWGDIIDIPEASHPESAVVAAGQEISDVWKQALNQAVKRTVNIQVGDTNASLVLGLNFGRDNKTFQLSNVLEQSGLVRNTSDLTRIKLTRKVPGSEKNMEWLLNVESLVRGGPSTVVPRPLRPGVGISMPPPMYSSTSFSQSSPNVESPWLQDGDVITIQDK